MLDKTLASKFRGQGSNPAARPTCEAGGLTYPVIQVYGRPNSVTGALYLPWGLDVLSNERRLAGDCKWGPNQGQLVGSPFQLGQSAMLGQQFHDSNVNKARSHPPARLVKAALRKKMCS